MTSAEIGPSVVVNCGLPVDHPEHAVLVPLSDAEKQARLAEVKAAADAAAAQAKAEADAAAAMAAENTAIKAGLQKAGIDATTATAILKRLGVS